MQLDQFKQSILLSVLLHEGGYVYDKDDKGGETYRGISRVKNPDWEGWPIVDQLKPLKRGDIINHSGLKEAVAKLYFEKYFKKNRFDEIESPKKALVLFDMAVNGGYSVFMVQDILNFTFSKGVLKDGVLGAKTLTAINEVPEIAFCNEVNKYRTARFKRIVEKDPTQEKFYEGWINRVRKLNDQLKTI
jgi:type VI secretion system secreted protein VgrG